MRKGFLLLVLSLICMMGFAQATKPQWTSITSNSPEAFKTQLISSSENSIKVNVQVAGFYTTTVNTPRGEAKVITVPKSLSTAQAGEPNVPMTGIPLMIGDKARMSARVIDAQYMDFTGIEVAPSKGDFPRTIDPETVPYTYGACYSQDAFFPASNLDLYEPYIIRDFRGQNMAVYPFAYNPATKTLRVYYNMTVELYKVDNNGTNIIESRRSNVVKMDPDFKSVYQRHFLNYEEGLAKYTALDEEGDLLIICYDNFINYMTDFVNWKKTRGINTTIVGTSTAGSSYSAIKTYIQNQYNANNNITHVLLVGDVAQIPGYTYTGGGSDYAGKGDNAYGQIVGSDIYNDVFIGRFSASSATRVTTQANRVITYERDLTTSATWLKVAEGISRKENGSGHNNEDDYQHMDNIRTDLLNYGYSPVYQRYANLTGYDGSSSTISSDINSGVGIINYANHGQETAWGANSSGYIYYANSHVNALTNENKLPFIFSVACLVGKYDHSSDCFAEAWMNATNNNNPTGAIGTLMSYISQPWIPPMWAQDECIDIMVAENKQTWGGVAINGLFGIFDHYSTSTEQAVGTYQAWILYGDPSMLIRTKTPTSMTVTHAGTIIPAGGTYTVNVTNGNGAVATITDANHNILGKATVANNKATINVSGSLTVGSELTLCVFGFNKQTYLGTITVQGGTQYTISTSVSPSNSGTVEGAGQYYESTECTLTATANAHYEFSKWTKNGTQVSTDNPFTFTVTGNATYVANFTALSPHTVTCNTTQNGTISASPTTAYKGETVTLTATPASGYCFGTWTVKAGNQNITVTNNQFTMPDANVTVSATFVPGYNVTLTPATNGTISANPTSGPEGTTITLTSTPASGYVLDSWIVYKTGDVTTSVTVTNNTFTLPAYDVTVVGVFSQPQGGEVTIGSGTNNNAYIPTYAYYNYTLSQQIYTASEVGSAGTITKVAFKVSNSKSTTRTIDIYLSHTSKTTFGGSSEWVSQGSSDKVYSGSVTFASSGWTTITLDTPFAYNGTSNLLLTVDDNTGSYVSNSSNSPKFYTYSTSGYTSMYKYNDDENYNPVSMSASGTRLQYNNQVVFTKEVPSTSGYLSVTPTSLSGFTAVAGISASEAQSVAVIGANLQANLTVTAPNGFEVSTASNGTYNSTLTLTPSSGSVRANVFVRLSSSVSPADYSGSMTLASGNTTASVSLSGTVNPGNVPQYTINATATTGGSVTGAGTYYQGNSCTLTATPNEHYTFGGWQLNGSIVSNSNPYTFTVTGNATYTAVFSQMQQYTVAVNPNEGGTITADPTTAYPGETITLTVSANTGFFFVEWNVKDANNNTVTVGSDNTFTMPESNVTVSAVFSQGFTVTLNQTPHGTISADQTTALQPGDIVTLTATPDANCIFQAWYVFKTGDPRDVIAVVTNSYFFMPASDVTVMAVFVTEEEHEQTIGGNGTTTTAYIPTRVASQYSLTQQIYTAAEIGYNGRITAIAFKANGTATRTLDVYMAHTDKTVFSSTTDWEIMGSVAKVYTGSVNFVNGWATITLDTPFEYDGTRNLNICVADRTGSTATTRNFSTYSTGANRALYINGTTDYGTKVGYTSINTSTYAGTQFTSNNQIKFTIKVPGSAESLTVSPDAINNLSYEVGNGPSGTHKLDIVGIDLSNDITLNAPENFELCATEDGTYSPTLTIERESKSRDMITWGFEGTFDGWTALDSDGDGYNWVLSSASVGVYLGSDEAAPGGHDSSTDMLVSGSWTNAASTALTPDNWLISPEVTLGGSFSMWACPQRARYPAEHFGIYVSTTGTNPSDFTLLNEWTISTTTWAQYSVDLSAFAGQTGHIAIRHFNCTDQFAIGVDDFVLDNDAAITIEFPVVVTPATVFVRMKGNLIAGTYSGILTANSGDITSNVRLYGQVTSSGNEFQMQLASGWNWFSSPIVANDLLDQVEQGIGGNGIVIKNKNGKSAIYDASSNSWFSNLSSIVVEQMYKIQTNAVCDITLNGTAANMAEHPLTINPGANWIGFPAGENLSVETAFSGFTPADGDLVKGKNGRSAVYDAASNSWFSNLTLEPGKGYVYMSNAATTQTVTLRSSAKGNANAVHFSDASYWNVNHSDFADNMTVVATLALNGLENTDDIEVAAFVNGQCRGAAKTVLVERTQQRIALIGIAGLDGENVSFRVLVNGKELQADETLNFAVNAVNGSIDQPFVLHAGHHNALSVFPNPVNKGESFNLVLPDDIDRNSATVEVYNALGTRVSTQHLHGTEIQAIGAPGVYTVKVTDQIGNNVITKIVVR